MVCLFGPERRLIRKVGTMYGQATLSVPAVGRHKAIRQTGLSDELAMSYGRLFAMTLLDAHAHIIVTLGNGTEKVIGHDPDTDRLHIGTLVHEYRQHKGQ